MMTLHEAWAQVRKFIHTIDMAGHIRTIGGKEPPVEAAARLEAAGYGSGGDEWREFVQEMLGKGKGAKPGYESVKAVKEPEPTERAAGERLNGNDLLASLLQRAAAVRRAV